MADKNEVSIRIVIDDLASPQIQAIRAKIAEASTATTGGLAAIETSSKQTKAALADFGTSLGAASAGLGGVAAATSRVAADEELLSRSFLSSAEAAATFATSEEQLRAELGSVGVEMQRQGEAAVKVGQSLASSATQAGIAITALAAGATVAIKEAIGSYVAFEEQIASIGTILDKTGPSLEQVRAELLLLDDTLGSSTELARGFYEAISAGIPSDNALTFTAEAAKFAKAGLTDTRTAVDVLTSAINAYGLQASEAGHLADAMFEAIDKGKTTAPELAGALGQVIPTAATLGVSFQDLSATVAKLTTVGLSTSMAVVSLNQALINILSPSKQAEEMLAGLRQSTGDASLTFDNLRQMLSQPGGIVDALGKLATATNNDAEAMTAFFGNVRSQRAVFTLLSQGADEAKRSLGEMTTAMDQGGQTAHAFGVMMASPKEQLAAASVAIEKASIAFSEGLAPAILATSNVVRNLSLDFQSLDPEVRSLAAIIGAGTVAMAGFGGATLVLMGQLPAATTAITGLRAAMNTAMLTNVSLTGTLSALGTTITSGGVLVALGLLGKKLLEISDDTHKAEAQLRGLLDALPTAAARETQLALAGLAQEMQVYQDRIDEALKGQKAYVQGVEYYTGKVGPEEQQTIATNTALLGMAKVKYAELQQTQARQREEASLGSLEAQRSARSFAQLANGVDIGDKAIRDLSESSGITAKRLAEIAVAAGESNKALAPTPEEIHRIAEATHRTDGAIVHLIQSLHETGGAAGEAGKGAAEAAAQIDAFNAAAAKATADELAKRVAALGGELASLPMPEALERLPGLLSLNEQSLDAEVQAIQAETAKKLEAAESDQARAAALDEERDKIQKATVASQENAQKLVDTVTHTESAVKITEEYAKSLQALQQAQDALQITVIDDQIQAITEHWNQLDVATRQSQLPSVLDLVAQKYEAVGQKANEANQKLIDNARATYDAAEAAYTLTGSEQDLASYVAALNALWGVTEGVQAKAALEAQHLSTQFDKESQSARDAAAGLGDYAQASQLAAGMSSDLAKAMENLLLSGEFKDLGKQLFSQLLDQSLVPFVQAGLDSIIQPAIRGVLSGLGIASFQAAGAAVGGSIASAIGSGFSSIGSGILTAAIGQTGAAVVGAGLGSAAVGAAVVAGVAGIGVGIAAAFGAFEGPTMVQQVARSLSKMLKRSLSDSQIHAAIDEGLQSVDLYLGDGLERLMIQAPKKMGAQVAEAWAALGSDSSYQFSEGFYQDMRERGAQLIHSSVGDVMHALYPAIAPELYDSIENASIAAGTAIAAGMGLVGDKAIKFAEEWAVAFVGMMQAAGKSAEEIDKALKRIDASLGTSAALKESFDALRDELINAGVDMNALFDNISAQIGKVNGKKVHIGDLDDVLAATGNNATVALGMIENGLDALGIPLERFSGQLSDVVLAISGDAGTAIRDASADMEAFGNTADGTAQRLEQKVVTALDDVVKTAEKLGYSAESVEALGTAASLISPELLKSDAVVQALHDSFAQMAVGAHMSVRELVDSIDPPLPDALRAAILSVDALGMAIGALSGAPLSSLAEVTDRMKQFAGDMYREVKDADGKITKELTAFGEQLVKDATAAVGGMWDTITADGVIDPSDIEAVFEQIAQIPEEVLGDPAVQSSIQSLLAMIGEQTGDAFVIGLSALPEVTKEQLDEALGIYGQWKKDVEDNPPEVAPEVQPPTNPDGTPSNPDSVGATGPDTSAATGAPPPAPVPPETLASWDAITESATAFGEAANANIEAVHALAAATALDSATILAALQPIIGIVGDGRSLTAQQALLQDISRQTLPQEVVPGFVNAFADADLAVSSTFTKVGELQSALTTLASGNYDIHQTITTEYVTVGSPQPGAGPQPGGASGDDTGGGGPEGATGGWIPGGIGEPFPMVAHGGEFLIPADIASRVVGGGVAPVNAVPSRPSSVARVTAGASAAEIGRAVADALTQGGRMHLFVVPAVDAQKLADSMVLTGVDRASRNGALTGAKLRRNPGWPR